VSRYAEKIFPGIQINRGPDLAQTKFDRALPDA
jgi:hypothetical protein